MGRVMAVDWGRRRVGVALSDPTKLLACPRPTLQDLATPRLLDALERMAREEEVETVIVGLPAHMDGREGESAKGARELGEALVARLPGVSLVFVDERLSTRQARDLLHEKGERARKSSGRLDQMAAAVLLQAYLDGERPNG